MKKHRLAPVILLGLCCLIVLFSQCVQEPETSPDPRGSAYAGPQRCVSCHQHMAASFAGAAHAASTRPASRQSIRGSFAKDSNIFVYHKGLHVAAEQRDDGFYQVAYVHDTPRQAERFDIVVGSGRKAQTYLYWYDDQVFQLPLSYSVAAGNWVNSPQYPPHQVRFDRNIPIGCFECHASYIARTGTSAAGNRLMDRFDRSRLVAGIDCERCHGPAAHHADFHEQHPEEKTARFMTSIKTLARQNRVEACAICHSGLNTTIQSTFSFQPGSPLHHYIHPDTAAPDARSIDVHGNQYQLLRASACFQKSNTLDCSSCHNVHAVEREDMALFSQRCMGCHQPARHNFCKLAPQLGKEIEKNCIDCHMPAQPSRFITMLSQGQQVPTPDFIRTHYIAVYREEAKKFLNRRP